VYYGRLLYKFGLDSYKREWESCKTNLDLDQGEDPINLKSYIKGSKVYEKKFEMPKLTTAIFFKISCLPYMRFKIISLPFRRFFSMVSRIINKLYYKKKKLLKPKGLIIAISGVDGSGKTTMLDELDYIFGNFLTINRFHLGKPQGKFIEFIWRALVNKTENPLMKENPTSYISYSKGKALKSTILALLRLKKARFAKKKSFKGSLILSDRWPTKEIGKMDGPRIMLEKDTGWFVRSCKRIETWAYNLIPEADICYFFEVPLEIAKSRNESRVKKYKETDEMITDRYLKNSEYKPIAKTIIRFKNTDDFQMKRNEFIGNVWQHISEIY